MSDLKKTVHWLMAASLIIYILTGYGITEFRTVDPLTFHILNKVVSMKIHEAMGLPFLALLLVHVYLSLVKKQKED